MTAVHCAMSKHVFKPCLKVGGLSAVANVLEASRSIESDHP